MVGHAGGKHQPRVVAPVQAVEPGGDAGQEAGSSFGLPVRRQRPAARYVLRPQVHHVEEVVIKKECEDLPEAEQGEVGRLLRLYYPETQTQPMRISAAVSIRPTSEHRTQRVSRELKC